MRSFFFAIGFITLTAITCAAQLLGGPGQKPADKPPAGGAAAGPKGGNAPPGAPLGAPRGGVPAAPQSNAMFTALDSDGDGVISKTELRKAIKALKTLDADDDGNITLAEASVGGVAIAGGGPAGWNQQIDLIMANDADKNGQLTPNEVPPGMIQQLQGVDRDGNGAIDRAELTAAMSMQNPGAGPWRGPGGPAGGPGNANQATGQFLQYDRDGNGVLTEAEMPPQANRLLKNADRNNDGGIDAGELQAALEQQGSGARALRGGIDPNDARGRNGAVRNRLKADGKN